MGTRAQTWIGILALSATLACASSSSSSRTLSPNRLAEAAPEIRSIRVDRYGASCSFEVRDPEEISQIASHFRRLRPGTANEFRTYHLAIEQMDGSFSSFTLGDDWVAVVRTGHTYQTSGWRFRSDEIFTQLESLAESRCSAR